MQVGVRRISMGGQRAYRPTSLRAGDALRGVAANSLWDLRISSTTEWSVVLTLDYHGLVSRDARITDIEKHRGVSNDIANRKFTKYRTCRHVLSIRRANSSCNLAIFCKIIICRWCRQRNKTPA